MSLESLIAALKNNEGKVPPVDLWNPEYCGEMDIVIKSDGSWYYNGTVFKRPALVKLFASVLKKEGDEYFLVTPVEKVKITVEEEPFVVTQWQWLDDDNKVMSLTTNLEDQFVLDTEHPVSITENGGLAVLVRRNLSAKIHRNVYYQWIELAQEQHIGGKVAMVFHSQDLTVNLGYLE